MLPMLLPLLLKREPDVGVFLNEIQQFSDLGDCLQLTVYSGF
jgi:hypothetical protein